MQTVLHMESKQVGELKNQMRYHSELQIPNVKHANKKHLNSEIFV